MSTPRTIAPYDPFVGSLSGSTASIGVLAPAPSGGDDYAALQTFINTNAPLGLNLVLQEGVYPVSAELTLPGGHATRIAGSPTQWDQARSPTGGTVIRAIGAIRSCFKFSGWSHSFKDIRFDANRLASHAVWVDGWSWGLVDHCPFVNGLVDGMHLTTGALVNDSNTFIRPYFAGNGTLYVTAGMAANFTAGVGRTIIAGTCSTITGNVTITMSGAPDLTTLGIRKGDFLIVGPFATPQVIQIESVTATTVVAQTLSATRPTASAAGLDFAIGVGDGYHEEQQSNNNTQTFITPFASGNGCSGLRFNGLYGPTVIGGQADFNYLFGISIGNSDGNSAVLTTKIVKLYQEFNTIGDYFLGSATGVDIDAPDASAEPLYAGALLATGTIRRNGYLESIQYGADQNVVIEVKNSAGTVQHRFLSDVYNTSLNFAVDRITSISNVFSNTPDVSGGAVAFTAGAGLVSTTDLILDTAGPSQNSAVYGTAVIEKPSAGQVFYVAPVVLSDNVNGVTKTRTALRLLDSTGTAVNWATITAGQSICVRINLKIR